MLGPGQLLAQATGTVIEWGAHATAFAVDSGPVGLLGGPRLSFRTLGSARVSLSLGVGSGGGKASGRGEAALEYLLSPRAVDRMGVYFGGGLAGVVGGGEGGYVLVYVGVEKSPGSQAGWALEAGLGGGFRLRAAYHWRRFPKGWRPEK
jgi:hypothetical protein